MSDPNDERPSTSARLAKLGMLAAVLAFVDLLLFNPAFGLMLPVLPQSLWAGASHFAILLSMGLMVAGFLLSVTGLLGLGQGRTGILGPGIVGVVVSLVVGIPLSAGYLFLKHNAATQADASVASAAPGQTAPASAKPMPVTASTAAGFFIPAMNRVDMVHDPKRNLLYITSADSVLRYQMDAKAFLPPLVLGGNLRGIDISPDGDLLAIADATGGNGRMCIHLVNLQTGLDSPVAFTTEMLESGTYSVAFGADGQIWITSSLDGSGFVPLRKYDPATRRTQKLQRVSQDTMLAASADRQSIGFAEADVTPGSYGRIVSRATQLPAPMRSNGFLYEIGISRDGSQLAVPAGQNLILAGSATPTLDEPQILAAAYHPLRDYLFVTQAGTSLLSVYDTTTMAKVKELDFGDPFGWIGNHAYQTGRLKLSQDGKYIFCTVNGGIRCAETGL